jgi:hypothetical protein
VTALQLVVKEKETLKKPNKKKLKVYPKSHQHVGFP